MKVTKVSCQGCGADLQIDESIRFVTCNFCGSRLEIVSDQSTTHSKLLEKLERQTDDMAEDLRVIRLQNELEQLDREWAAEKIGLMITNKNGSQSIPSAGGAVVGGVVMVVFGIFWTIMASSMGAPGLFPLFGVGFICFAVFMIFSTMSKAERFKSAQSAMDDRRRQLLEELEKAKRS